MIIFALVNTLKVASQNLTEIQQYKNKTFGQVKNWLKLARINHNARIRLQITTAATAAARTKPIDTSLRHNTRQ